MLSVADESFNGVPALHIYDQKYAGVPLPVVLYWHGFTSAKEHNLPVAYQLARQGIRVILPEARHHGEREEGLSEKERFFQFWSIVLQSLHETSDIYDALNNQELIKDGRIFCAGTSMGGILTCGVLAAYPWIKGGAVMMGTPAWEAFARRQIKDLKQQDALLLSDKEVEQEIAQLTGYDLSQQPGLLLERPLFFWHGTGDPVISFEDSAAFYNNTRNERTEHSLKFQLDETAGHKVSRKAMLAMADWTADHI